MATFSNLKGTFATDLRIGKNGPRLKNNSGVLQATDSAGSEAQFQALNVRLANQAQLTSPGAAQVAVKDAAGTNEAQLQALNVRVNNNAQVVAPSAATVDIKDAAGTNEAALRALSLRVNNQATLTGNAGTIVVKDAAGSLNAKIFAADPAGGDTQGLVTVNYFNTNPPAGVEKVIRYAITEAGTATQDSTSDIPDGSYVTRAVLLVTAAFGVGNTVTLGTTANTTAFQGTGDNNVEVADDYVKEVYFQNSGAARKVRATLSASGSGTGAAQVWVWFATVVT
jgi:hypothetical protein